MKKNEKAIVFVRVSTQRQKMDQQEAEIYDLAIRDGYSPDNIICICEKESAIKLAEEERNGLNRMKEEIAKGQVTCIYVWEISRLARRQKILHSVIDYIVDHRIQLVIKNPFIKYLNEDGTRNEGAEMMVAMLALGAETEIRKLKERERRTKKANALKGRWNGGKNIKYGYSLDENNYYIVNEEEAKVIRLVYEIYTTTAMGQTNLRKELSERGYKLSLDRLQKILSDIGYTGTEYQTDVYVGGKLKKGYTIKYPAIISKELFDLAEVKRNESNVNCYRGQSFYFAKGLFRCPQCGYAYQGYKMNKVYCCLAWKHDNKDIPKCHNTTTININLLDSLLWSSAMTQWMIARMKNTEDYRQSVMEQMLITTEKIDTCWKEIEAVDGKLERIGDLYADGVYTKEKYQAMVDKVRESAAEVQRRKQFLSEEYERLEKVHSDLGADNDEQLADRLKNTLSEAFSMEDLKSMSDIVHRFIKSVAVQDVEKFDKNLNGKSKMKKVTITLMDGTVERYYAYNFSNTYKFWDADKKPLKLKLVLRKLGRNK